MGNARDSALAAAVRALADDPEAMLAAHKTVEDVLIDFRDSRIGTLAANGFVVREHDGENSSIIRLGIRDGIRIALRAIADHLGERGVTGG